MKLIKLQAFDPSYFGGKNHFQKDGTQSYFAFQPMNKCFKRIGSTKCILEWKSKGLSDEIIKFATTSDNSLASELSYFVNKKK